MTQSRSRWVLAASLLVLASPAASRAEDASPVTVEASLARAAGLLSEQNPGAALQTLLAVERAEPENPWLWFLRGRAHLQLEEPYLAMESFDRALDSIAKAQSPDEALAERIRAERRLARRQVHSLSLRAGFAYDSNATYTGGGVAIISGKRDYKAVTGINWDFAPIATREEAWIVGLRLNDSWYTDIHEFNEQAYGGYARYVRRLSEEWRVEVQYDLDFSLLDRDSFLWEHSIGPRVVYHWPAPATPTTENAEAIAQSAPRARWLETSFNYSLQHRDFLFSTRREFDRDGLVNSFGVEQSARVRPFGQLAWDWNVSAGYRLDLMPTEGSEFDRVTHDFSLGFLLPMKGVFLANQPASLRLSAEWELDDYANGSLYDHRSRERRDLLTTLGLVFSQTLADNEKDGEVLLHAIFQWTDADSNIRDRELGQPFSYEKTLAGIQLEWRF